LLRYDDVQFGGQLLVLEGCAVAVFMVTLLSQRWSITCLQHSGTCQLNYLASHLKRQVFRQCCKNVPSALLLWP